MKPYKSFFPITLRLLICCAGADMAAAHAAAGEQDAQAQPPASKTREQVRAEVLLAREQGLILSSEADYAQQVTGIRPRAETRSETVAKARSSETAGTR